MSGEKSARTELQMKANSIYQSLVSTRPDEVYYALLSHLKEMKALVIEHCKSIRSGSTKEVFEEFKESVHDAYVSIGSPFIGTQNYEIPFKIYSSMLETTKECIQISSYPFDKGFEYSSLSITELGLGNLEKAFSHMELALVEDERIDHTTGVARQNLEWIVSRACEIIDDMMKTSILLNIPSAASLFAKLDWPLKCRLAKTLWKFHDRIRDEGSSLNNEDLERNFLNLCKIVENYLRSKFPNLEPKDQTLGPLIDHAFGSNRLKHSWYAEWKPFPKRYDSSADSENRLIDLLSDKTRRYETNIFLALYIVRNFSAHILNDQSDLFLEANYDKAFSMCVEALMYALTHV